MNLLYESQISRILIDWYEKNKRDLPWRDTVDPYKIWISEIILQQTRVNQGLDYFYRFIDRFKTVSELAKAEEDEVMRYWQGLGYYSRARNLHKAAKQIEDRFSGCFPENYSAILELSGIGDYTAAAICSFAYNQPYAVVDGNVFRVLSRLFAIETPIDSTLGKKEFSALATRLLSLEHPALHNQAIMEFGALQCVPGLPNCNNCPLKQECVAFRLDRVTDFPQKQKKTKVSTRYFNYLYVVLENEIFLQKRTAKDIWQNLYEFPLIETDQLLSYEDVVNNAEFKSLFSGIPDVNVRKISNPMKHILSHRVIHAQFFHVTISQSNSCLDQLMRVSTNEINRFAISRLTELFLEKSLLF